MLKYLFFIFALAPMAYAGIIGRNDLGQPMDNRRPLTDLEKLKRLDISATDAVRIRKATGYVDCRGRDFKNPILGSGALIGGDDILVTNAHIFIDEQGRWREPRGECFFQNQDEKPERRYLSFAPGDFEIIENYRAEGGANDYAVIRLKSKIDGAKAFPVSNGGAPLVSGMSIVTVSAVANSPLFDARVPVVQLCQAQDLQFGTRTANTTYLGDCDIVKGQSGSVDIAKVDGEWQAIGIVAGFGDAPDGTEYNPVLGSYSYHVAIRDSLYSAIRRLMGPSLSSK